MNEKMTAPVQPVGERDAVASLMTNVQSGDVVVAWNDDGYDREMWHETPLYTHPELSDAEIDALRSDLAGYVKVSSELATENEALRRDAERYRAVRDDDCHPYAICIWDEDDGWAQDARKPDVVDAAIDAALAAARRETR